MRRVVDLSQLSDHELASAGGKGASLARLFRLGLRVPPGFVILAPAFVDFVREAGAAGAVAAILSQTDPDDPAALEQAGRRVRRLLEPAALPAGLAEEVLERFRQLGAARVAVRSSATVEDGASSSWAGQLETFLNTPEPELLDNVKRCWLSLYSPRALTYGERRGESVEAAAVAVVVQAMVDSDVSGVLFSAHPVTGDPGQMVIEAALGLGEAVVSGAVTPDRYVVAKSPFAVIERAVAVQSRGLFRAASGGSEWRALDPEPGRRAKLADADLAELSRAALELERATGAAVDVEWAFQGGRLYVLQSRPLTALPAFPATPPPTPTTPPREYWFSWGESCTLVSAEIWMHQYRSRPGMPGAHMRNALVLCADGAFAVYCHESERARAAQAGAVVFAAGFLDRFLAGSAAARAGFEALHREARAVPLEDFPAGALLELFRRYVERHADVSSYSNASQPEYLEPALQRLKGLLRDRGLAGEALEAEFAALTTPFEPDVIRLEERDALLLSLQAREPTAEDLWRHGDAYPWLFAYTFDRGVMLAFLRGRVESLRRAPEEQRRAELEHFAAGRERQRERCEAALARLGRPEEVAYLARLFRDLAVDRLRLKDYESGAEYRFLPLFEAIAARAGLSAQELLLTHRTGDTERLLSGGGAVPAEVRRRRLDAYTLLLEDGTLSFFDGAEARALIARRIGSAGAPAVPASFGGGGAAVTGTVANAGFVRGRVRLVRAEGLERLLADLERFVPGDILVTTMTQPTMLSLTRRAAAIVTDEGGITSHASVLARELGIPCIVGTERATRVFADGDRVEVDAHRGVVTRLPDPVPPASGEEAS